MSCHGMRNQTVDARTDSGRASRSRTGPMAGRCAAARPDGTGRRAGRGARTARSGRSTPSRSRSSDRRPVGQAHVAEDQCREVGRQEARDMGGGAHGVGEDGEREDADGEQGGRAAGHSPQRQPAQIADGDTDRRSSRELEHDDDEQLPPRLLLRARHALGCEGDDEEDDGGVVNRPPPRACRSGDAGWGRCAGRRRPRPRPSRPGSHRAAARSPRRAENGVGGDADHDDGDDDPDGREDRGRGDGPADVAPLRRQPALGEDEHQSGIPRTRVVDASENWMPAPVAQGEADAEVDEQRWHPRRHREPHRGNRHEQDDRANEQHACEVVESHSRRRDGRERGHGWLLSWRWTPSNHSYAAELAHTKWPQPRLPHISDAWLGSWRAPRPPRPSNRPVGRRSRRPCLRSHDDPCGLDHPATLPGGVRRAGGRGSVWAGQRDAQDVGASTIYADTAADLFQAQGYVSAQDRFFEMDLRRHITAGRLSELVGEAGVETDRVIRTMGWRRVAEQELPKLAPRPGSTCRPTPMASTPTSSRLSRRPTWRSSTRCSTGAFPATASSRGPPSTPSPGSRPWPGTCVPTTTTSSRGRLTRGGRTSEKQINLLYPPYPFDRNRPILSEQDWDPTAPRWSRPPPPLRPPC